MSRLLTTIEQEVAEMTTQDWSFYLGTLPEQNILADDVEPPVIMLRAPLNSTSVLQDTGMFLTTYQLVMAFVETRQPEYTARENTTIIDRCNAGKVELFRRLQRVKDSQGRQIFKSFENISTLELYREYDISWCGILVSASVGIYEDLTVC